MIIDGVLGSAAIDSSGEVLDIEGADISDWEAGTMLLNWEHSPGEAGASTIVGKVIYAKKIFKAEDCENERQRMYWDQIEVPFIYGVCRLWDKSGHAEAKSIAAIIRDCAANNEPIICRFSVEGSTLKKEGNVLKRSVIRRVAVTTKPCNRTAVSGLVSDDDPAAPKGYDRISDKEKDKLLPEGLIDTEKHEHPMYSKLGGSVDLVVSPWVQEGAYRSLIKSKIKLQIVKKLLANRENLKKNAPAMPEHFAETMKQLTGAGFKVSAGHDGTSHKLHIEEPESNVSVQFMHHDQPTTMPAGHMSTKTNLPGGKKWQLSMFDLTSMGSDKPVPDTQHDNFEGLVNHALSQGFRVQAVMGKPHPAPMAKTITAGMPIGAPSTLTGGEALQREDIHREVKSELDVMDGVSLEEAQALAEKLGVDLGVIDIEQFRYGIAHEREHATVTHGDAAETAQIAYDHLKEDPDYYKKIAEIEKDEVTKAAKEALREYDEGRDGDLPTFLKARLPMVTEEFIEHFKNLHAKLKKSEPEADTPTVFLYQRAGMDNPHVLEVCCDKLLLDGMLLDDQEQERILQNIEIGAATIRYKNGSPQQMTKSESIPSLLVDTSTMPVQPATSISEVFERMNQLVAQGAMHANDVNLTRDAVFLDPMCAQYRFGNRLALDEFKKTARPGVNVFIDLNNFKSFNDELSHQHGDAAIVEAAGAISRAIDKTATSASAKKHRAGGDEFHVYFENEEHVPMFLRELRSELENLVPIAGTHRITMSVGIGTDVEQADKAQTLAKIAKRAALAAAGFDPNDRSGPYPLPNVLFVYNGLPGKEGDVPQAPEMPPEIPAEEPPTV